MRTSVFDGLYFNVDNNKLVRAVQKFMLVGHDRYDTLDMYGLIDGFEDDGSRADTPSELLEEQEELDPEYDQPEISALDSKISKSSRSLQNTICMFIDDADDLEEGENQLFHQLMDALKI